MSSDNRYGLDFRVWGYKETKKKDTTPDILKNIGHGWGESSKPKKQEEVVEYTEERIEPKKEQITCILKNARFLPDENTDFGKPCKIRVEIEGESHRLVHLYLWAVYNGVEHDLRHEVEANHNKGICETEMPLFYVEPYHNDVFKNGKKDAKVEYFAKIKMHGAKEIRSELMVMPRPPAILNINEIDGPGSLAHDTKGVYVVKSFNREATQEEKDSLSWAVKINGKEIERFENVGDSFEYTPGAKYAGETITVHPFLRSPSDNLFIKTTIGQYLLYNGSELIWLDESHKEVGKWKACSNTDTTDPAKENGPIPQGNWVILQDAIDQNMENSWWKELTGKKDPVIWADKNRVELVPFKETDTQGRLEKFYVFGGEGDNSSLRGINLAGDIDDFVDKFKRQGNNLVLKYLQKNDFNHFNINWQFIQRMEGTKNKIYVPCNKDGDVLGVSGATIASGFDLGQIDTAGLKAYRFSIKLEKNLLPYVSKKGNTAKSFVDKNPLELTDSEITEINKKVKNRYVLKAAEFFDNDKNGRRKFKQLSEFEQTIFVSVYFQYGTAKTLRSYISTGNLLEAVNTLLNFTTKTFEIFNKNHNKVTKLMQYLERRCQEARFLLNAISDPITQKKALDDIQKKEAEWEQAHGKIKFW